MTAAEHAKLGELLAALDGFRATLTNALAVDPSRHRPAVGATAGPLAAMLLAARSSILDNPAPAKGVVAALGQLGREHAKTSEGAELLDRIVASPQVAQLRTLWETVTLNMLDEIDEPSPVPAAWLDLMLDGLANEQLADAIATIRPEGFA